MAIFLYVSGDINQNYKIEADEIWKYSCTTKLLNTTTNTAIATGKSDDPYQQTTTATAIARVVVSGTTTPITTPIVVPAASTTPIVTMAVIPKLPNTGINQ